MYCLCRKNGRCDVEIILACDESCTTKIRRGSDSFENRRERNEALDIGIRKFVFACNNWCSTGGFQSGGEKLYMLLFIMRNELKVTIIF